MKLIHFVWKTGLLYRPQFRRDKESHIRAGILHLWSEFRKSLCTQTLQKGGMEKGVPRHI
jgi:hypothetical protein